VSPEAAVVFEVRTPVDFTVCETKATWSRIVAFKHPVMAGRESEIRLALENPDQIRRSRTDPSVFLFYKSEAFGRWT